MKVCDLETTQTGLEVTDESAWTKLKVLSHLGLGLKTAEMSGRLSVRVKDLFSLSSSTGGRQKASVPSR